MLGAGGPRVAEPTASSIPREPASPSPSVSPGVSPPFQAASTRMFDRMYNSDDVREVLPQLASGAAPPIQFGGDLPPTSMTDLPPGGALASSEAVLPPRSMVQVGPGTPRDHSNRLSDLYAPGPRGLG